MDTIYKIISTLALAQSEMAIGPLSTFFFYQPKRK